MKRNRQSFLNLFLFLVLFFGSLQIFAKKTDAPKNAKTNSKVDSKKKSNQEPVNHQSSLAEVVKKYRNSNFVKMQVTKIVKSDLLGKETQYKGQMFLSRGKFRWDNDVPEKTQLIFNGSTIWNIQFPPKELPGPLQIAKSKVDKNTKKQILISTLLSANGIDENFKVKSTKVQNAETLYELEPKGKDLGITQLKIKTNNKKSIIEINYKDDVGNQTSLKFDDIEFSKKSQNKLFDYVPPKGAQVTNL